MNERLTQQLAFLNELEKLKIIYRICLLCMLLTNNHNGLLPLRQLHTRNLD